MSESSKPSDEISAAYERGLREGPSRALPRCTCREPKGQAHDEQCLRGIVLRERRDRAKRRIDTAEEIDPLSKAGWMGHVDWKGTEPARGSRRAMIRNVLRSAGVMEKRSLELADAVESALLQVTIDAEALAPAGNVRPGTTELHIVLAESDTPEGHQAHFIELEDQDGRGCGGFERRQGAPGLTRIVIPYARDDEWVAAQIQAATGDLEADARQAKERIADLEKERWRRIDELEKERDELAAECQTADDRAAEALIRVDKMRSALARGTERVEELENQLENVRETLDKVDAPRAATFAQRIGMLFRELTRRRDETVYDRVIRAVEAGPEDETGGASIVMDEAAKALNHLVIARERLEDPVADPAVLARINHAITAAHMVVEPPSDPAKEEEERQPPVMADDPDREALLLEQREEARAGEDHWKSQRDAALNLLRWVISDLLEHRSDA